MVGGVNAGATLLVILKSCIYPAKNEVTVVVPVYLPPPITGVVSVKLPIEAELPADCPLMYKVVVPDDLTTAT